PIIRGRADLAYQNPADDAACRCIDELMAALDAYVPPPVREEDRPFLLAIEGVNSIPGQGTVLTGRVERGRARVGGRVLVLGRRTRPSRAWSSSAGRWTWRPPATTSAGCCAAWTTTRWRAAWFWPRPARSRRG